MNQPGHLERAQKGAPITARLFNGPIDLLNRMGIPGPARQYMPNPLATSEIVRQGMRVRLVQFGGFGLSGDWWQGYDLTTEPPEFVYVAQPLHLRKTLFDGRRLRHQFLGLDVDYNYEEHSIEKRIATVRGTDPLAKYYEVIRPQYMMVSPHQDQNGDTIEYDPNLDPWRWIWIMYTGPDRLGLTIPDTGTPGDPDDPPDPIVWTDMNLHNREFVMVPPDILEVPPEP